MVISIYDKVSSQVLTSGMGGAIALNELAVMNRIKLKGIQPEEQEEVLDEVMMVGNMVISLRNAKQREEQENG